MKKSLLLFAAVIVTTVIRAQKVYTYVQQDGTKLESLGTAAFDLSDNPTVTFQDGKAVMTVDYTTVAVLPLTQNGELTVEFSTDLDEDELNKVTKTVGEVGYATIYSPFQLQVYDAGVVEVYSPTYDSENHILKCNPSTQVAENEIAPAGTGLLLRNEGTVQFSISTEDPTAFRGALEGSALKIPTSEVDPGEDWDIYTLGHEKTDNSKFGFLKYTGTYLNAGSAYLIAPSIQAPMKIAVKMSFGNDMTLTDFAPATTLENGKFLEDGQVKIIRDGRSYNMNGYETE